MFSGFSRNIYLQTTSSICSTTTKKSLPKYFNTCAWPQNPQIMNVNWTILKCNEKMHERMTRNRKSQNRLKEWWCGNFFLSTPQTGESWVMNFHQEWKWSDLHLLYYNMVHSEVTIALNKPKGCCLLWSYIRQIWALHYRQWHTRSCETNEICFIKLTKKRPINQKWRGNESCN